MTSEKQLILIILVAVVVLGYQWYKDKKKNDYWKKYRRSQGWEKEFRGVSKANNTKYIECARCYIYSL